MAALGRETRHDRDKRATIIPLSKEPRGSWGKAQGPKGPQPFVLSRNYHEPGLLVPTPRAQGPRPFVSTPRAHGPWAQGLSCSRQGPMGASWMDLNCVGLQAPCVFLGWAPEGAEPKIILSRPSASHARPSASRRLGLERRQITLLATFSNSSSPNSTAAASSEEPSDTRKRRLDLRGKEQYDAMKADTF